MPRSLPLFRIAVTAIVLTVALAGQAVAAPNASLDVAFAPGSPAPPVLDLSYAYSVGVGNTGDVSLDNLVVIDALPIAMDVASVTTGRYTALTDFAAGEGVRVSYEKSTAPGVFTLWGSSPNTSTNTTLTAPPPGLGAGEYLTRVRWEYGQAAPGMAPVTVPQVSGKVTNPDNAGGPIAVGDPIQNCATVTANPGSINLTDCQVFNLIAGPSVALSTAPSTPRGTPIGVTATLTGGDPTGSLTFRVFAADDTTCASPLLTRAVTVDGTGPYPGPTFDATDAGAYTWVAAYGGDTLHAAAATGCNDPEGAFAVVAPPSVSVAFGAAKITVGESTPLTFTITNPAANTVGLTGVALQNSLPAELAVASPNGVSGGCGAGTIDAVAGSQAVALTGGTIDAGGSCSFSVAVTGATPGEITTTTDAVQSANGGTGNTAAASLTVVKPPPPPPPVIPPPLVLPTHPLTARELRVSCSPDQIALSSARVRGHRVRFRGLAQVADAGQRVIIRSRSGAGVARATVRADGSFAASGRAPRGRAVHKARYVAQIGARRSPSLKLTRRVSARVSVGAQTVTISGRVTPPLTKPRHRVAIRRLTSCSGGYVVVARVKPNHRGRFRVTLPKSAGGALYTVRTTVRTKAGGRIPTVSPPILTD